MYTDLNKELTDDQKLLKEQVHEFSTQVMRPASIALDKMTPEETIAEGSPMWSVIVASAVKQRSMSSGRRSS